MDSILSIEAMSYGPAAIARRSDGKTVFVHGAAPGDVASVRYERDHGSYVEAQVESVIEPSPDRAPSPCPHSERCGGCPWAHLSYEAQTRAKEANLRSSLLRIGKLSEERIDATLEPLRPAPRPWSYRNKIELACVEGAHGLELGYRAEGSHELIAVDVCPVAHKMIARLPRALRGALRYLAGREELKIFRVALRHSERTGDLEVALWTKPGRFPRSLAAKLIAENAKTSSIVRVIADEGKRRRVRSVEALAGKGFWRERLGEESFKVSAPSFFQVNTEQAESMIQTVVEALDPGPSMRVADLYSGCGSFTLPLARSKAQVSAVESAASAVRDLRRNAKDAGLVIECIGGDSGREFDQLTPLDALVVDPPAAGLAKELPAAIAAASPRHVAYVSCNPTTLARDLRRFIEAGYEPWRIMPFDLFPQTYHLETVCLLAPKGGRL